MHAVALSSVNADGLRRQLARIEQAAATPGTSALADVAFSVNTGRRHLPHRAALVATSLEELREAAAKAAQRGDECDRAGGAQGGVPLHRSGSRYAGMGRAL